MSKISIDDEKVLIELLKKCEPGALSPEVFEAVGRVSVYPAVEFIPLRKNKGRVEVFLIKRALDDITWPSMLHTPGTVLRPTDESIEDAFKRLYADELAGVLAEEPIFIEAQICKHNRGTGLLLEYLVNVKTGSDVGAFYDVQNLPDNFIEQQKASLYRAVSLFNTI